MLQPALAQTVVPRSTGRFGRRLQHQRPTSDEVGMRMTQNTASNNRRSNIGSNTNDPPLTR